MNGSTVTATITTTSLLPATTPFRSTASPLPNTVVAEDDSDEAVAKYDKRSKIRAARLRRRRQQRQQQQGGMNIFGCFSTTRTGWIMLCSTMVALCFVGYVALQHQVSRRHLHLMAQYARAQHIQQGLLFSQKEEEEQNNERRSPKEQPVAFQRDHGDSHKRTNYEELFAQDRPNAVAQVVRQQQQRSGRRFGALRKLWGGGDGGNSKDAGAGNDNEQQLFMDHMMQLATDWMDQINQDIINNVAGGIRWIRPYLLPPLPGSRDNHHQQQGDDAPPTRTVTSRHGREGAVHEQQLDFFRVQRNHDRMAWMDEYNGMSIEDRNRGPIVDYTQPEKYLYPPLVDAPPASGGYPALQTLREIFEAWPQDEDLEGAFTETLLHFNYSDPAELDMARRFRDAELPFKLYNVPEVTAATAKWTDDYVSAEFKTLHHERDMAMRHVQHGKAPMSVASGNAQESPNHFFAFFVDRAWDVALQGVAPVRNNDWDFSTWAKHARYADAVRLASDQPHFYWQSGVSPEERHQDPSTWSFISRDLPSWSNPESTFFVFHPKEQKGIQCRFGERGVVAATHYDGGRNMVAMVTGAKRYILSPPNQCSMLGIFTSKRSPIYRHSLLDFGHLQYLNQQEDDLTNGMSTAERAWLERAGRSRAIDTVLKAGEVLYIPSFWFHYIISVQKSAQCNARSGVDNAGTTEFGGPDTVLVCRGNKDESAVQ